MILGALLKLAIYGAPVVALILEIIVTEDTKDKLIGAQSVIKTYRTITLLWAVAWFAALLV